jgi:hypothetical protein
MNNNHLILQYCNNYIKALIQSENYKNLIFSLLKLKLQRYFKIYLLQSIKFQELIT